MHAKAQSQKLVNVISCHSWSADGAQLALSPNSSELHIYSIHLEQPWVLQHVLQLHDKIISGVDWCHRSGRLLTCSHDQNAFVLTYKDQKWTPDMVITRLKRAALCIQWSPSSSQFAIGGAAKEVSVCFQESDRCDWWGSLLIREHGSAVTGISWHPNGQMLATICADGICRVFHAVPKGGKHPFGGIIYQSETKSGWGNAVAWSATGTQLAFCSHGSQLSIIGNIPAKQQSAAQSTLQRLQCKELPFRSLAFLQEDLVVAAGFDGKPCLFACSSGHWRLVQYLTGSSQAARTVLAERQVASDFSAKLALFKSSPAGKEDTERLVERVAPTHGNAIVEVRLLSDTRFSTVGLDGRVAIWDVAPAI